MTPEERTLLSQFLGDLARTQGVAKDQEAAAMIDNAIRSNPDSGYVLVQHALMADQALHQAQAQIAQLQAQLAQAAQPAPQPSFLGGGFGSTMAPPPQPQQGPWGQQPPPQPQQAYGSGPLSGGGGLGSFLRSAGTMAAGVAGGELLFSGLSGMFGGHGGGFGGGFGGGGYGGGENVTINNYNDDDGGDDRDDDDYSGDDDSSF